MCCSAARMTLKQGFFNKVLKLVGIFLVVPIREKKTQVFDMFITFTFLVVAMFFAHD